MSVRQKSKQKLRKSAKRAAKAERTQAANSNQAEAGVAPAESVAEAGAESHDEEAPGARPNAQLAAEQNEAADAADAFGDDDQPAQPSAEADLVALSTTDDAGLGLVDERESEPPSSFEDADAQQDHLFELDAEAAGESEDDAHPATLPAGDVSRSHLKGLIEALVFVSDKPVSLNEIAKSAGKADRKLVRSLVDDLRQEYRARGIHLEEVAGGLVFRTNPAYGPFIRDAAAKKPVKMTRAQLEALAIIAYRQPLTRPEVDEIRGVDSGPVIKMLLDRDLIRILGKKDEPGRPLLYGTTPIFLEFFGLKSLKDLPSLREFTELSDDSRKVFDREMSEVEDGALPSADTLAAAASAVAEEAGEAREEGEPQTMSSDLDSSTGDPFGDRPTDPSIVAPRWGEPNADDVAPAADIATADDLDG